MDANQNNSPSSEPLASSNAVGGFARRVAAWQVLLALIVVAGAGLRLYGLGWDAGFGHSPHPDERAILDHVQRISLAAPWEFFDAESSGWNPRWFNYGSFPLYLLWAVEGVSGPLMGDGADIRVLARAVSALADVGTIVAAFGIGALAFDRRTGLLAAGLTALAVVHIQLSHFFAVDTLQALLAIAALYFMLRVAREGKARDSALAGALVALGIATKASQLPIVAPFAVAHVMFLVGMSGRAAEGTFRERMRVMVRAGGVGVGVGVATFVAAQPYAFLDWDTFIRHVSEQSELLRGIRDYPYTRQYADTAPYWYHIRQLGLWGYGAPLGIAAWGGLLYVSLRGMPIGAGLAYVAVGWAAPAGILLVSQSIVAVGLAAGVALAALVATLPVRDEKTRPVVLLLCWVAPFFLITGAFHVKFMRYLLPIAPLLALFGARMLFDMWDAGAERRRGLRVAAGVAIGVVVVATGFYGLAYVNGVYGGTHTAVRAAEWLNGSAADGANVVKEHWEESLPALNHTFVHEELRLYEDDGFGKTTEVAHTLSRADYLIFFSNRLYGTIPRLPERYPITGRYYRALFSGELGYTLVRVETAYPELLGVRFVDDTFGRPGLPEPMLAGARGNEDEGALTLDLGYADESFSVYDHPKVMIFRNEGRLDISQIQLRIDGGSRVARGGAPDGGNAGAPDAVETGMGPVYSDGDLARQRDGGTWSEIVRPGWLSRAPALGWLGVVEVVGLLALPLTLALFRGLPDRGYVFAKTLGVLVVGLVAWLLASLQWVEFSRGGIAMGMGVVALASLGALGAYWRDMVGFVRRRWRVLLAAEALFLGAFLVFMVVRMANPDLWHPFRGGEKPMDFAYLNAVLRSSVMPPYDPWFAGGYLNYYYWGQFLTAMLIRVTGVDPAIAVNLAVPTFFALTIGGAYSVVYNMTESARRARAAYGEGADGVAAKAGDLRLDAAGGGAGAGNGGSVWDFRRYGRYARFTPAVAGLAGAAFVAVLGNMDGAIQVGKSLGQWLAGQAPGEFDFWRSSRMMPPDPPGFEITEFPFFTFLFADLHAHLIALPFTLLAVGLALAIVVAARRQGGRADGRVVGIGRLVALGVTLGALIPLNVWDLPTYLAVSAAAILLAEYLAQGGFGLAVFARAGVKTLFAGAVGYGAFLPYHLAYETYYSSLQATTNTTVLWQFLAISGLAVFIVGTFAVNGLADDGRAGWMALRRKFEGLRGALRGEQGGGVSVRWVVGALACALLLGFGLTAAFSGVVGSTVPFAVALFALLLAAAARLAWADVADAAQVGFAAILGLAALGLVVGLDFWRVEGDIDRLNSVFKFYLQAWVLLGLSSAYLLWRLVNSERTWLTRIGMARELWTGALIALVICAAIYPVMGTRDRLRDRFEGNVTPLTLDGTAFIAEAEYRDENGLVDLAADYEGILWLKGNVEGSPVVLEASTPTYRWGGRVSIYTGMPSVVGWEWHQQQQRFEQRDEVVRRIEDVRTMYRTTDAGEALGLMREYGVEYVYVGQLERLYFPGAGLDKFEDGMRGRLDKVFDNGVTAIYRVGSE